MTFFFQSNTIRVIVKNNCKDSTVLCKQSFIVNFPHHIMFYKNNTWSLLSCHSLAVHTGTLFANIFGCLSWFCVDASRGVDFGLAMLWFMLFTPCSFVCWYRPLYGAFRYTHAHTHTVPLWRVDYNGFLFLSL